MIQLDKTKTYRFLGRLGPGRGGRGRRQYRRLPCAVFGASPAEWKWRDTTNTWECDDPKFGRWGWEDCYFFSALCLGLVVEKPNGTGES